MFLSGLSICHDINISLTFTGTKQIFDRYSKSDIKRLVTQRVGAIFPDGLRNCALSLPDALSRIPNSLKHFSAFRDPPSHC